MAVSTKFLDHGSDGLPELLNVAFMMMKASSSSTCLRNKLYPKVDVHSSNGGYHRSDALDFSQMTRSSRVQHSELRVFITEPFVMIKSMA